MCQYERQACEVLQFFFMSLLINISLNNKSVLFCCCCKSHHDNNQCMSFTRAVPYKTSKIVSRCKVQFRQKEEIITTTFFLLSAVSRTAVKKRFACSRIDKSWLHIFTRYTQLSPFQKKNTNTNLFSGRVTASKITCISLLQSPLCYARCQGAIFFHIKSSSSFKIQFLPK